MAIAYDTSVSGGFTNSGTSLTWSHTCTGSNGVLLVTVVGDTATDVVTGATYNGVAMTLIGHIQGGSGGSLTRYTYLFGLIGPATGANTVAVSASSAIYMAGMSSSYTGVSAFETGVTNTAPAGSSSLTLTATTGVANCWLVAGWKNNWGNASAGTGTTMRQSANDLCIGDSNAALTAGSQSLIAQGAGFSSAWAGVMVAMEPASSVNAARPLPRIVPQLIEF